MNASQVKLSNIDQWDCDSNPEEQSPSIAHSFLTLCLETEIKVFSLSVLSGYD